MMAHAYARPAAGWLDRAAFWLAGRLAPLCSTPSGARTAAKASPDAAALARFQALMLPHLDAAHNLARFLCRDADTAQDIVQEAFLRAFRGFADYRGGNPRAWILAIVRNCHRSWWQGRQQGLRTEPLDVATHDGEETIERSDLPHEEADPESLLLQQAEAAEIREVLGSLPEIFREVLVLREMEELSYREISDTIAAPMGTVMSRLARARTLFVEAWRRRRAGAGGMP